MPLFPEGEVLILNNLKNKEFSSLADLEEVKKEQNADVNGSSEPTVFHPMPNTSPLSDLLGLGSVHLLNPAPMYPSSGGLLCLKSCCCATARAALAESGSEEETETQDSLHRQTASGVGKPLQQDQLSGQQHQGVTGQEQPPLRRNNQGLVQKPSGKGEERKDVSLATAGQFE
ncbi:hypothetical protein chiPu_0012454 [Chiloscyllium punctatum]|uniref:Uncharacterized protein n=1 Tax=Chiloscyllium punctatum TaxID=137246 RepID=A0A401SUA9_CHIPU|nr:hypothetical protein [Chiloscyllium punctatum]